MSYQSKHETDLSTLHSSTIDRPLVMSLSVKGVVAGPKCTQRQRLYKRVFMECGDNGTYHEQAQED